MKVSYSEGVAIHTVSESCTLVRKDEGEALTGVRAGEVLSREIEPPSRKRWPLPGADALELGGRQNWKRRYRETLLDLARSETLRMHASTLCGNRELPCLSARE
jgi:RNA-directed DNA polymerase